MSTGKYTIILRMLNQLSILGWSSVSCLSRFLKSSQPIYPNERIIYSFRAIVIIIVTVWVYICAFQVPVLLE